MKRFCSFFIFIIMLFAVSSVVFSASNKTYELDDLEMSIDIPTEYVVFTRNISDNDPNLSDYGLNKKDLSDMMRSKNIYLNAWDKDVSFEIIVTMIESSISDFNLFSDTILNTMLPSLESEYANRGITIEKKEIYQHNQAKFIKIYINQLKDTEKVYGLQYYTVYNNKAINVTLQSYSGKIDSHKEDILKSIVNTVHFDKSPLTTERAPDSEAFVYKDEKTGCKFTVPANWSQKPLSQSREFIDVKFSSNEEPGLSILYGSYDLWSEMSLEEKKGLSKSDVNNSMFTLDEVAEMVGVSNNKITTVNYGKKEYYEFTTANSYNYGIELKVTMTCFMRIENGITYMFQFAGDNSNVLFKDFESLLDSVKYPTHIFSDLFSKSGAINIPLSIVITITVYSLPIIIYRYIIHKRPVKKSKAKKITIIYGFLAFIVMSMLKRDGAAGGAIIFWSLINYGMLSGGKESQKEEQTEDSSPILPLKDNESKPIIDIEKVVNSPTELEKSSYETAPKILFCRHCGAKLVEGVNFCNKCGIRIEQEDIK